MKLNAFWKGLIMALVGFIATMLSDLDTLNFAYIGLSTLGFTIIYVVKNAVWPSISVVGIDIRDVISGVILAVGMAISSFAAQLLTTQTFEWSALGVAVLGAIVGYFAKTIPSNAKK